jgi:uncharacterized DUF497 family protein
MRHTWDAKKAASNLAKHGIYFHDAARIFEGEVVEWIDKRFDYDEERWAAIGLAENKEIPVIYLERDEDVRRIISARPATRRECRIYWQQVGR